MDDKIKDDDLLDYDDSQDEEGAAAKKTYQGGEYREF